MASVSEPKESQRQGLRKVFSAALFSVQGLQAAFKLEEAFRQEVIASIVMITIAVILPVSLTSKALLIGSILIILIAELLNSGLEWTVDYISSRRHPYAKRAKDMGSAAVFLCLINCAVVWCLVIIENWDVIRSHWTF